LGRQAGTPASKYTKCTKYTCELLLGWRLAGACLQNVDARYSQHPDDQPQRYRGHDNVPDPLPDSLWFSAGWASVNIGYTVLEEQNVDAFGTAIPT
jgi:hypothetical protein